MMHAIKFPILLTCFLVFTLSGFSQSLHVEHDSGEMAKFESQSVSGWLTLQTSSGVNSYLWAADENTYLENRGVNGILGLKGDSGIGFDVDFQRAMTIDDQRNVGIGVLFPNTKLDVYGSGQTIKMDGFDPYFGFYDNNIQTGFIQAKNNRIILAGNAATNSDIEFRVDGMNAMLIDGVDNKIGISDITPAAKLSIIASEDALDVGQRTGNMLGYLNLDRPASADGINVLSRWRSAGSSVVIFDDQNANYQITTFGDGFASGGFWTNSDKRLKKEVKEIDGSLAKVMQLKPKKYRYDTNNEYAFLGIKNEVETGFIAQELEQVFPESVRLTTFADADQEELIYHDLYSVNYQSLIPILTQAIQEQQQIIQQMQGQLNQTQDKVDALQAQIEKVEE